jgi:CSLREA domain-containing protein
MSAIRYALIFALIFLPASPFATTFPVTKTADTDDGTCDPDCSLREAIDAANTNPGADDVPVPAGTYLLTLGQLNVLDDVSIAGAGQTNTVIDGNATGRVFSVPFTNVVEISGVTIQNGYRPDSGAGVFNRGALTIRDSTVSGNTSRYRGGGITDDRDGTLTLINSTVSGNSTGGIGGGIYDTGIYDGHGTLTLINSTVSGNTANIGGGIFNTSYLTLTNSTVSGNTAYWAGGGIYTVSLDASLTNSTVSGNYAAGAYGTGGGGIFNRGTLTLTGSTVSGNTSRYFGGGGIFNRGTLTLTGSTVSENWAIIDDGGGILNAGSGAPAPSNHVTLINSTVSGNVAGRGPGDFGGGIFNASYLTLTNSTVSGNHSTLNGRGGGIATLGPYSGTTLTNSTVSGNRSDGPGVIYDNSSEGSVFTNTIVADNDGDNCAIGAGGLINSIGYNLTDDTTCGLTATGDLIVANALLYPLGNFGGPTKTHHPMTDSPAIDMADDASCPAADQRGEARPFDGDGDGVAYCDIGSVEYLPEPESWPMLAAGALFLGAISRRRT